MLADLADACRKSGLNVVELPHWRGRRRPGDFKPAGVLVHHTGGTSDARSYVDWMALQGRPDLPAPLCQIALDRKGTVYVCAAGRANHGGKAKKSGPMPAGDANALYIGIEALNDGSEGWRPVQYAAYVRLCAALCVHYGWPASHVRAHKETSVTGKVDPGRMDMDQFRRDVAAAIDDMEDDMAYTAEDRKRDEDFIVTEKKRADRTLKFQKAVLRRLAAADADLDAVRADLVRLLGEFDRG